MIVSPGWAYLGGSEAVGGEELRELVLPEAVGGGPPEVQPAVRPRRVPGAGPFCTTPGGYGAPSPPAPGPQAALAMRLNGLCLEEGPGRLSRSRTHFPCRPEGTLGHSGELSRNGPKP